MARLRSNTWQGDVTVGLARRRQDGFKNQQEAELWEAQVRDALVNGKAMPQAPTGDGARWSLKTGIDKVTDRFWRGGKSEATMVKVTKALMEYFGRDRPLSTIDENLIDDFVAHLIKIGNSNATINRKLSALSKIMRFAADRGAIPKRPKIDRRKESQGRIRFLTNDEEAAVLRLADQWGRPDHRDAIMVLIDTGLRLSELFALGRRDIDLQRKTLTVWMTKTDKPRTIPMTPRVLAILRQRSLSHPAGLFPYDQAWMRHTWDQIRSHMGHAADTQFVPHALRHTFVSRLVQIGVHLVTVKELAGHKSLQTTMRYAHLAPSNLTDAIALLAQRNAVESPGPGDVPEGVTEVTGT